MATAYAAMVSLLKLLTRIQHPTCPASFESSKIEHLFDNVRFLVDFLEQYSHKGYKDFIAFEIKMIDAAYGVEDIIESCVVARTYLGSGESYLNVDSNIAKYSEETNENCGLFLQDLDEAILKMDFIIQEAKKVEERHDENDFLAGSFVPVDTSIPFIGEIKMVGFDEQFTQLMKQLFTNQSTREILPVVGMGGIGKSTLARSVYNSQYAKDIFDVRAWVTISQTFNVGTILRALLKDIGIFRTSQKGDKHLADELYKHLFERKYLIVLDDIWSSLAWDEVRRFFPDQKNGSRILLTTRLINVARTVGSCCPYELEQLKDDSSYKLLSQTVFGQDVCIPELEKCGEKIARTCQGLPLAIVLIGGLLKMSHKTLEYWQHVSRNVYTLVNAEIDGHFTKVLSLSYYQLPVHLKPCFLYMATFPEDCELKVSEIVMLWVADGFLKPAIDKVLEEEVALEYLYDLVSRNLILVKERNSEGKMKTLSMHDLVRDLCVAEAQQESFLHVRKDDVHAPVSLDTKESQCCILTHVRGPQHYPRTALTRVSRSLAWFHIWDLPPYASWLTLVRVFVSSGNFSFFHIAQLVNSRLLKFSFEYPVENILLYTRPSPWNLETLIVHHVPMGCSLPWDICELRHLRHLIIHHEISFPSLHHPQTDIVLYNLQTLKTIVNFSFSNEVISRIPNIRKLGIVYYRSVSMNLSLCFDNVVHCHKLETLTCTYRPDYNFGCVRKWNDHLVDEWKSLKLPTNLGKLTLSYSRIPWENMSIVSSLPNLEVLKLHDTAFSGDKWNLVEGEFPHLKVLSINNTELVTWTADDCCFHFPMLERLSLRRALKLQEIPVVGLSEVTSLKLIELHNCSKSVFKLSKKILEKQKDEENQDLTIQATFVYQGGDNITEMESLADDNYHIRFMRVN